jgi:hypothetical protein
VRLWLSIFACLSLQLGGSSSAFDLTSLEDRGIVDSVLCLASYFGMVTSHLSHVEARRASFTLWWLLYILWSQCSALQHGLPGLHPGALILPAQCPEHPQLLPHACHNLATSSCCASLGCHSGMDSGGSHPQPTFLGHWSLTFSYTSWNSVVVLSHGIQRGLCKGLGARPWWPCVRATVVTGSGTDGSSWAPELHGLVTELVTKHVIRKHVFFNVSSPLWGAEFSCGMLTWNSQKMGPVGAGATCWEGDVTPGHCPAGLCSTTG